MEEEVDFTKLKYVLYARRSTKDKERQVRSIPDQIKECRRMAESLGINIVRELKEKQSAKIPRMRPIYRQMIIDLKKGKYDGIIAWNPDRLARNMLEGGEIINLVDEDIIKDLKFKTHYFTKDANGKMLLGMAFVLSKQYSDDLSQKVKRGVGNRLSEGLTQTPKHGYLNEKGIYRADGKNFELISNAWKMRAERKSIEEITEYLNQNGYYRQIKSKDRKVTMTKQSLSPMFHDPFYYGVLLQTKQEVDLRQIYDFEPAVSEADYFAIQEFDYRKMRPSKNHKTAFYPLRGIVQCSFCGSTMVVAPSTSGSTNKKRYLYIRCDNEFCERKKKSIRSKIVFDFVYDFLFDGLNLTEKEYDDYYSNFVQLTNEKSIKIKTELHNLQGMRKQVNHRITSKARSIIKYEIGGTIWKVNSRSLKNDEEELLKLDAKIAKLENQLRSPDENKLTIEQFLNLSKNSLTIVKSADALGKDLICKELFLNFKVDEEKVTDFTLKEPFATLLKGRMVKNSREYRIRTCNLTHPMRAR